jgi:hypothetical protein
MWARDTQKSALDKRRDLPCLLDISLCSAWLICPLVSIFQFTPSSLTSSDPSCPGALVSLSITPRTSVDDCIPRKDGSEPNRLSMAERLFSIAGIEWIASLRRWMLTDTSVVGVTSRCGAPDCSRWGDRFCRSSVRCWLNISKERNKMAYLQQTTLFPPSNLHSPIFQIRLAVFDGYELRVLDRGRRDVACVCHLALVDSDVYIILVESSRN